VTSVFSAALNSVSTVAQPVLTNVDFYRRVSGTTGGQMLGNIDLPSGIVIEKIRINSCDHVGGLYTLQLFDATTGPSSTQVGTDLVTTLHNPPNGCGFDSIDVVPGYDYDVNEGHHLQISITQAAATSTSGAGVGAVEVWWRRKVSPAPPLATFNDVPTDHRFFQFIEALYAAGITGGCSASPLLYCPDAPLTRGQSAVFLANVLGLDFPH
jgi:hypothetical protein